MTLRGDGSTSSYFAASIESQTLQQRCVCVCVAVCVCVSLQNASFIARFCAQESGACVMLASVCFKQPLTTCITIPSLVLATLNEFSHRWIKCIEQDHFCTPTRNVSALRGLTAEHAVSFQWRSYLQMRGSSFCKKGDFFPPSFGGSYASLTFIKLGQG